MTELQVDNLTNSRLDRLGRALKSGTVTKADLVSLAAFRNGFYESTEAVARSIEDAPRSLRRFQIDITQRPAKSTGSIIAKLQREHCRLAQMQDIGGLRLVVMKMSVQEKAIALVRYLYPEAKVVDRRSKPQHGYRAVHVIVTHQNRLIEIQVRTRLQNAWAQFSEKLADEFGDAVKYGGGPQEQRDELAFFSETVGQIESLEMETDARKPAMNLLSKRRKAGKALSKEEKLQLVDYEQRRQDIREIRARLMNHLEGLANT